MTVPRRNPSAGDRAGAGDLQGPRATDLRLKTGEVVARADRVGGTTQPGLAMRSRNRKVGAGERQTRVDNC